LAFSGYKAREDERARGKGNTKKPGGWREKRHREQKEEKKKERRDEGVTNNTGEEWTEQEKRKTRETIKNRVVRPRPKISPLST
jgi:hypothetical protein